MTPLEYAMEKHLTVETNAQQVEEVRYLRDGRFVECMFYYSFLSFTFTTRTVSSVIITQVAMNKAIMTLVLSKANMPHCGVLSWNIAIPFTVLSTH